jgi:hypothetical protein
MGYHIKKIEKGEVATMIKDIHFDMGTADTKENSNGDNIVNFYGTKEI